MAKIKANGIVLDTAAIKKTVEASRDAALKAIADQVAHRLDDFIDRQSHQSLNRRAAMAREGHQVSDSILNNSFQDLTVKTVKQTDGTYKVLVEDSHSANQENNVFNILNRGRAAIVSSKLMTFPVYDIASTMENSLELIKNRLIYRRGKLLFAKTHSVRAVAARNFYETAAREVLSSDFQRFIPKRNAKGQFVVKFKKSDFKIKVIK